MAKRIAIAGLVVVTFLAGIGVGIPFLVKEMAGARIDRVGASLKGVVRHDDFRVAGLTKLLLSSLTFSDPDGLEITVRDIELTVDPIAMVTGGRKITSVDVGEFEVQAGSDGTPVELARIAGRLISRTMRPVAGEGAGATGGAREASGAVQEYRKPTPLPDVRIRSIKGEINSSYFTGTIVGGSARIGPDPAKIDAFQRVGQATVSIAPRGSDQTFVVTAKAELGPGFRPEHFVANMSPPFARKVRGIDLEIGSIGWRPREIRLLDVKAALPASDRFPGEISAGDIMVRWKPLEGGDVPAMRLVPEAVKKYIPGPLAMLMNAVSVSEVRVTRPVFNLVLPGTGVKRVETPPTDEADEADESDQAQTRLRDKVKGWFGRLLASEEGARKAVADLAAEYPGTRIGLTGATIRYVRPGGAADTGHSLSNVDLVVERTEKSPLSARLRFESPESRATQNEFGIALAQDGAIVVDVKAQRLLLAPYRIVLPSWMHANDETSITDTDMKIKLGGDGKIEMNGRFNISRADIDVPEVASQTMTAVDFGLAGSMVVSGPQGAVTITDSVAHLGDIRLPFSMLATSLNDRPAVKLDARIERLEGTKLMASIPREAIPVLAGARLEGTFAATMKLEIDTGDISKLVFDFSPDMADLVTVDLGPAVNLELLRSTFVHRIEEDNKVITRKIGADSPDWVPYDQIPSDLVYALISCEDAKFFTHQGFSKAGIQRSLKVNLEKGGFFQGASTLSQQLVKNLFLSREKTLSRKLQEAFITWQIEKNLPKEKILELYLNVIEWGPDVWGLKEAANHYFGKAPKDLTVLESAFLVLVIPNPIKYHKFFEERRVPAAFMARVRKLVSAMNDNGVVTDLEEISAAQQTIRFVNAGPAATVPDSEFTD